MRFKSCSQFDSPPAIYLLVGKGCLDCFVNTLTPTTLGRVHGYLAQVATLLARADEDEAAGGNETIEDCSAYVGDQVG